ncbi:unnamed protein product [Gadus morhua 'NCC']
MRVDTEPGLAGHGCVAPAGAPGDGPTETGPGDGPRRRAPRDGLPETGSQRRAGAMLGRQRNEGREPSGPRRPLLQSALASLNAPPLQEA